MTVAIRRYEASDEDEVVELSIRAWAPVFESMAALLGTELDRRLHGQDWREHQAGAVRATLSHPDMNVFVAVHDDEPIGFVAAVVRDRAIGLGEIEMLAVDPHHQNHGVGTALTDHGTNWLRSQGLSVAMIGTGGDRGHAPARRAYDKAGYRPVPLVRYFKAL